MEYPAKCTSFDLIYSTRTPGSLENEPVLISGKIIWEKKEINQCPHYGDVARKNIFFTEQFPVTTLLAKLSYKDVLIT